MYHSSWCYYCLLTRYRGSVHSDPSFLSPWYSYVLVYIYIIAAGKRSDFAHILPLHVHFSRDPQYQQQRRRRRRLINRNRAATMRKCAIHIREIRFARRAYSYNLYIFRRAISASRLIFTASRHWNVATSRESDFEESRRDVRGSLARTYTL